MCSIENDDFCLTPKYFWNTEHRATTCESKLSIRMSLSEDERAKRVN